MGNAGPCPCSASTNSPTPRIIAPNSTVWLGSWRQLKPTSEARCTRSFNGPEPGYFQSRPPCRLSQKNKEQGRLQKWKSRTMAGGSTSISSHAQTHSTYQAHHTVPYGAFLSSLLVKILREEYRVSSQVLVQGHRHRQTHTTHFHLNIVLLQQPQSLKFISKDLSIPSLLAHSDTTPTTSPVSFHALTPVNKPYEVVPSFDTRR